MLPQMWKKVKDSVSHSMEFQLSHMLTILSTDDSSNISVDFTGFSITVTFDEERDAHSEQSLEELLIDIQLT